MAAQQDRKVVKVVVLGDIGRSPRMQYHALSLANNGLDVNIIGYLDSQPLTEILEHPHITITKLRSINLSGPAIVRYVAKAIWQTISLLLTLVVTGKCHFVLCQNPPAIPTLPVCRIYCLFTKAKYIIDWHNYAYSIMAMSLTPDHYIVRFARFIEKFFGQSADNSICVTYSMKEDLLMNWNVHNAIVLYDRPPKIFKPLSLQEKHDWFLQLSKTFPEFGGQGREQLNDPHQQDIVKTLFTCSSDGQVQPLPDRPGLLFSSTSWTPDEDFGLLMEALQMYESACEISENLPKLICVITGKGPEKDNYLKEIARRKWQNIRVFTPWLDAADYPKMVGSADLGVCLHTSSSGLDLPMKIVDMFGAGLPVCAFDFLCLDELVENGVNGYTFRSSNELFKDLVRWFEGFPNNTEQNKIAERMRKEIAVFRQTRWEDNWNLRVKKLFV
ncbi:chitobiosyldiphosphodolichol beta-mannosyltransferase [Helicoverpa zea]|uniref:chitobiosyldiphosphodolichol beta-mannosyltransferase n=1 Tax=Helicoverpa zea TaxID=7113 RepID=UPI001F576808|nr:chitobiosyldiphosphodolichol beta-mannosyltransferase [Helicoverpa zea]